MNLTFGICTVLPLSAQLAATVASIQALNIPTYQILIMDGAEWHSLKKNRIAKQAEYDTLCLLHDYYLFDPGWYEGWAAFDQQFKWDVASNPQYLLDGQRHFTDWVLWDHPSFPKYHSLEYTDWSKTRNQYISGGYFLAKRDFLRQHPIDESMPPGNGEDVEWSLRIRQKATIVCNPTSSVRHNKIHRDYGRTEFPFRQGG